MKFTAKSEDKDFFKLKDGESAAGVFLGEPYEYHVHWANKKSVVCSGIKNGCELCKAGDEPKFRFRINFIVKDGDTYVAKVLEQGWNFYKSLNELNTEYPLEENVMKITRNGTELNTKYSILPAKNGEVTSEQASKLKVIKLNNLAPTAESADHADPIVTATPTPSDASSDDDIPF